jgi:rhodanese-related sulfurtransferase
MGPFVPDIITDEMNLVVALVIGIGFGFVLEQAGFSSSRRLAGLFYGYDFTVLRVFFTAGVTAMSGVLLLGYFGLLDTEMIYVNPLYLWPAILGGIIMGFGFILGGYCPGTSVCAAAIGKVDGMIFVLGGVTGAFLFAEAYPLFETFYNGSFLGPEKIYSSLGISQGVFALGLIVAAVGAFTLTTLIEKKVSTNAPSMEFPRRSHILAGIAVIVLGVVFLILPDRKEHIIAQISDPAYEQTHPIKIMSDDELAFRIVDKDPSLVIVDVRDEKEFSVRALPQSVNIPMEKMFGKEWIAELGQRHKKKVFVANDETRARTSARLANRLGYENVVVLHGGFDEFNRTILQAPAISEGIPPAVDRTAGFRSRASLTITKMILDAKTGTSKTPRLTKKIKGGC